MDKTSLGEIAGVVGGRLVRGNPGSMVVGVTTDSRDDVAGMLFVPLKGEKFDGHEFIRDVARNKAVACVAEQSFKPTARLPEDFGVVLVEDTLAAYQALGAWNRLRRRIPLVAITGSCGKTSTKEMLTNILLAAYRGGVVSSKGNENNEIGVPKTLLRIGDSTKIVVQEMGMRGPGEIALLARLAEPNFAVITNVEKTHIGRLGSEQAIADAKGELVENMNGRNAVILNADNRWTPYIIKKTGAMVIRFGVEGKAEVKASSVKADFNGVSFVLQSNETKFQIHLPVLGKVNVYNALAASSVAMLLGIGPDKIQEGLNKGKMPGSRMKVERVNNGQVLIDDTYNSNPSSLRFALELLRDTPWKHRRVAILGDMLELGEFSREEHRDVGRRFIQGYCDLLITYGHEAKQLGEGALHVGVPAEMILHFDNLSLFKRRGLSLLSTNDLILVKGSRGVKMEEIVHLIKGEKK